MTDRGRLISLLSEIAEYFGGCRENASFGSKAEEHFWELKNAATEAAELLKAQEQRHRLEVHNIGNVDIPDGVTKEHFYAVMNNVVDALEHTDRGESWPYEEPQKEDAQ